MYCESVARGSEERWVRPVRMDVACQNTTGSIGQRNGFGGRRSNRNGSENAFARFAERQRGHGLYCRSMLHRLSLSDMRRLMERREASATELADAHLARIRALDPQLRAFVEVLEEEARQTARELDQSAGPRGPLHGVPITVKDSFDMSGLPTLCGSRFRLEHRATADATAVQRLRRAGAVILGKTNCPEFLANYETDNALTGWTANPWDMTRSAGGSSGGEASAIAARLSAGGIGSDGGGSIRVPAHMCGIAGLKPTPGRVSAAGHFPEIAHPGGLLGVAGPMARTVEDVRALFHVLAGHDDADPFSAPVPLRDLPPPQRVGVAEQFADIPVQEPARQAVRKAAKLLEDLGIATEAFTWEKLETALELWWFFFAEIPAPMIRELTAGREDVAHWTGTEIFNMVEPQRRISATELVDRLGYRDRLRVAMLKRMEPCPVLVMPVCGVTAFRPRERQWWTVEREIGLRDAMAPSTPFNLFGLPGLSIPMDVTEDGFPVGVQLVGRPWEEERLLELGVRLEEARGPFPSPPCV